MDILLINPHLEFPDKNGNLIRSKEYLINFGLLSLASYLDNSGIDVKLCDLTIVDNPIKELEKIVSKNKPNFVGISNQSCNSYLSTKEYAKIIKSISKECKIIIGGLHVSGIPEKILTESNDIDSVVIGEGELVLEDMIKNTNKSKYDKKEIIKNKFIIFNQEYANIDKLPKLNYKLYPDFQKFVPSVEESRGCVAGCEYCISPLVHKKMRIRTPEIIIDNISELQKLYDDENLHFYMEANNFGIDHKKTEKLSRLLADKKCFWRTETRTDTFPAHLMNVLSNSGLKVLDVGLESGSPEMLLAMKKTNNPEFYLEKGLKLAESAKNDKCLLRFNIMLYYGETYSTINTTMNYLKKIAEIVPFSIGACPVRLEPGSKNYQHYVNNVDLSRFKDTFWSKVHCYPVDLSREISFEEANKICLQINREFQTSRKYYESKKFSQLPYNMTYKQFMKQSELIPENERQWKQ